MSPPARISVPVKQPSHIKDDIESISIPSTSMAPTKKPRVVARRRARGRVNETDSDSEVVREPRSDSDTDTVTSSLESESLSDSETEDEPKSGSRAPSPADPLHVAEASSSPIALPDVTESLFPKPQDWSDMVTDEKENGPADLPVVDFADFSIAGSTPQPEDEPCPSLRSSQFQRKRSHSRDKVPEDASSSKRNAGFARHAYLQKLNSDPAYVPTVGQFWSHDDRLLDKNLRSLSGWWRGKWQGNGGGRGRGGFAGGGRGRGRGGFNNVSGPLDDADDGPWKHDRFGAEHDERQADTSRVRGGGQSGDVWKHDLFDATDSDLPRKGRAPKSDWKHGSLDAVEDDFSSSSAVKPSSPEPALDWGGAADWAAPIGNGEPFQPLWDDSSAVSPKGELSDPGMNNDTSEFQVNKTATTQDEWGTTIDGDAPVSDHGALTSASNGAIASADDGLQQSTSSEPRQRKKKPKNEARGADTKPARLPDTDTSGWATPRNNPVDWVTPSNDAIDWVTPSNGANDWAAPNTEAFTWEEPTEETKEFKGDAGWAAPQENYSADINSSGHNQGRGRRKAPRNSDGLTHGPSTRGRVGNIRGRGRGKGQFNSGDGFSSPKRAISPRPPRVQQPKVRPARMRTTVEPTEPDILAFGNNVRPWFAMKPERVWTKQFDGYLYSEVDLKPVPAQGLGQGVRIKLPGTSSVNDGNLIVRLLLEEAPANASKEPVFMEPLPPNSIVVKLPSLKSWGKQREMSAADEVATLNLAPLSAPQPTHSTVLPESQEFSGWGISSSVEIPQTNQQSENWSSPVENVEYYAHDRKGVEQADQAELTHSQPPPHPLQTFPPPFQPSASYGSPYSYPTQGLPLPLGFAYAENGMTYEIATGRAVYLQTPPPPPPQPMPITMYNPQPMPMHHGHHGSVHFIPHLSPLSMSPPGFPPLFSLPRQSSRVEIRAPDGEDKGKKKEVEHVSVASQEQVPGSRLAADAEPFTPATYVQAHTQPMEYYAAEAQQSFDDAQRHQQTMYQQAAYYYPMTADGNNPYGYAQHYPGVDVGQPQQYSSYGQEPYPGGYY